MLVVSDTFLKKEKISIRKFLFLVCRSVSWFCLVASATTPPSSESLKALDVVAEHTDGPTATV